MREVTDDQRRARLATRHAIGTRAGSVAQAVEQMTCLHATEPASVYLSAFARVEASRADIDQAFYDDRSVAKQLAMRRTLFAFPRDLLPAVWGSASARVAAQLSTRFAKEIEGAGIAKRGDLWINRTFKAVLQSLAEDGPATTSQLRERIPPLDRRVELSPGKKYGGVFPVAPRLLGTLGATGQIMRGSNTGDWKVSRSQWVLTEEWLGAPVVHEESRHGLRRVGPALAAHLRTGHRGRPGLVARRDQGRRTPGAGRARRSGGRPRRRGRLPASRRPGRRTRAGAVGCPAAGARPHHDGLEAARLLPRPRTTSRTCSTATATPAPPPGGRAGSSGAGSRTRRAWSRWCSGTTSGQTACALSRPRLTG